MAYLVYEVDGKIIKARVQQKTDTLANWLANTNIILEGEQAFVVNNSGQPINFKIGDGTKTFSELPFWIQYDQAAYINTYTATPTQPVAYTIVGQGTYGGITVGVDKLAVLGWNGTSWFKNVEIDLPKVEVKNEFGESEVDAASQKLVTLLKEDFDSKLSIITNEEFLYAIVDANNVLLWGKRRDGTTYDCDLSTYEYTDSQILAVRAIITDLTSTVNTINVNYLPKSAVKNEVGTSTTDPIAQKIFSDLKLSFDAKFSIVENEEFLYAIVGANGTLLWGKRRDGSTYDCDNEIPKKIEILNTSPAITQLSVISNNEFIYAIVDSNNVLLWGKRVDGTTYDSDNTIINSLSALNVSVGFLDKTVSVVTNGEFIYAIVDANNMLLWGKRRDGTTYDSDVTITQDIQQLKDRLTFYDSKFSVVSNAEYIYAIVDADNRLIDGVRKDGVSVIQQVETKKLTTDSLVLTEDGMTEFQKALKDSGFTSGTGDWSDNSYIMLPKPRQLAKLNFISRTLPTTKTANLSAEAEYFDIDGNYFKSKIVLNAQGSSSMAYVKKNFAIDLIMNDGSERVVKFGDWVHRDSFHVKAYYIDSFVGQSIVGYRNALQYYNSRPIPNNRPYKKYYTAIDMWNGSGDLLQDMGTEAYCMPDGFPVELYHNGEYYGLYVIALSKHRSNYNLNKDNTNHVFLDGELGVAEIFGGVVDWTKFEIRNPNKLKTLTGASYNGDNPQELSNTDAKSLSVKNKIIRLSNAVGDINGQSTDSLKKSTYEQYFDVQEMIDYVIDANVKMNYDGFRKNWLWTTYNGLIWQPNYYDQDSIFSLYWRGSFFDKLYDPSTNILGTSISLPSGHIFSLYRSQLELRYKQLRDLGIISVDNIYGLLEEWVSLIGKEAYSKNFAKWTETPSYRANNVDTVNWEQIAGVGSSSTYDSTVTYTAGSEVYYGMSTYIKFRAKTTNTGKPPIPNFYANIPQEGGCYNSLDRVRLWLIARINKLDNYFNYTFN